MENQYRLIGTMKLLLVLQYVPLLFMSQKGNTLYFCKMFLYLHTIHLRLLRRNFKNFNTRGGLKGFWVFFFYQILITFPGCVFLMKAVHIANKKVLLPRKFLVSQKITEKILLFENPIEL